MLFKNQIKKEELIGAASARELIFAKSAICSEIHKFAFLPSRSCFRLSYGKLSFASVPFKRNTS